MYLVGFGVGGQVGGGQQNQCGAIERRTGKKYLFAKVKKANVALC